MAGLFNRRRSSKRHGSLAEAVDAEGPVPEPRQNMQKKRSSRWSLRRSSQKDEFSVPSSKSSKSVENGSFPSAGSSKRRVLADPKTKQRSGRRQVRRSSFGGSSGVASQSETSSNSRAKSARFSNSRKSSRRTSNMFEEEKKESASNNGDEYYETPEFRNRVAQEAADLDKEGNFFFEKGDFDKAFLSYERALKLKRATLQVDKPPEEQQNLLTETESQKASILASVATSINNMTYLRQRAGQATADETMAAYLKSLQIKREILGPNHLSVGKTLNNIGSVFYLKKEFVPALKAYENAHEIMGAQLGHDHLDVGTVLSNIGDVHSAMRHRKEALEYYRRALDIRWAKLGRADPKVIRLMEQTAALLTGRQPKKDDELSESDDEEFVKEDERRREEFKAECQALAEELVEDIKFFDLVERTMAIEMVKQKTQFVRTMRQLSNSNGHASANSVNLDNSLSARFESDFEGDSDDDSSEDLSVMSAPPNLDFESSDSESEEAPEVLAFLEEIGATRKFPKSKQPRTPPRKTAAGKQGPRTPPTSPNTPLTSTSRSPSYRRSRQSNQNSAALPQTPGGETPPRAIPSYPVHRNAHRLGKGKSATALTADERRLALMSVKERVDTLKSKRVLMEEGELDPAKAEEARQQDLIEPKRTLYLDSAQSPQAKVVPEVK